jgi:hypothetical protein
MESNSLNGVTDGRFRAIPFECSPVGFGIVLVENLLCHKAVLAPAKTPLYLSKCNNFRTIHDHAALIADDPRSGQCDVGTIAKSLRGLIDRQLLMSEQAFFDQIPAVVKPRHSISTVAVVTADRSDSCVAAVESISSNAREHSRRVKLVVMDDSASGHANRNCLHAVSPKSIGSFLSVWYGGRGEREKYIKELAKAGIEPEIAQFALLGDARDGLVTPGANRNCVLLDTIGECVLTSDDDIVCNTARHPEYCQQLRVCCDFHPRDLWFYKDRKEVLDQVQWSVTDLVREHELLLGASVSEVLSRGKSGFGIQLEDICSHLLTNVLNGAAVVSVTMAGIAGDSGWRSAKWLLTSRGRPTRELLRSEMSYNVALTSREIFGVSRNPTISHSPSFMATNIGLDNRAGLPPFFPISRGEDAVFGSLLFKCFPQHFTGHIPVAVLHNPPPGRRYDDTPAIRICELIHYLISSFKVPIGTTGLAALRLIGKYLEDVASLPLSDFCNSLVKIVRSQEASKMQAWQRTLPTSLVPGYWHRDLWDWHSQTTALLTDSSCFVPVEFNRRYSKTIAILRTKELVSNTGKLFRAWPDLLEAARDLSRRSRRVCRRWPFQ